MSSGAHSLNQPVDEGNGDLTPNCFGSTLELVNIERYSSPVLSLSARPIYEYFSSLHDHALSIVLSTKCRAAMMAVQQEGCNENPFDSSLTGL